MKSKEETLAKKREFYAKNATALKAKRKKYYQDNKEAEKQASKAYYASHKKQQRKAQKHYRDKLRGELIALRQQLARNS